MSSHKKRIYHQNDISLNLWSPIEESNLYLRLNNSMPTYTKIICKCCNESFNVLPKNKDKQFCNTACYRSFKSSKKRTGLSNCANCNNILVSGQYKFCSNSCSATYNNLNKCNDIRKYPKIECVICKTITTNPKYCCKSCMGEGHKKYSTPEEGLAIKRARGRESYARYAAKKKFQTPVDEDLGSIRDFYLKCPPGYEVDHIVPISKGGLHSLLNLQYLTSTENKRKGNKLNWYPRAESNG